VIARMNATEADIHVDVIISNMNFWVI